MRQQLKTGVISAAILGLFLVFFDFASLRECSRSFSLFPAEKFVHFLIDWYSLRETGHLERLGAHQAAVQDNIDLLSDYPDPRTFYERYVKPGKPCIFRGLAQLMPASTLWNDEYLREKYGHNRLMVETRKAEDRKSGAISLNISDFLSIYKRADLYMVDSLPYDMLNDVVLPRSVLCKSFLNVMTDAVLWFSSGGTKSVLHYDDYDNINCLLDGTKEFFMVDKKYSTHIQIVSEKGAYSDVDVDSVDMKKYPGLQTVPWYNISLTGGDCLYIPYGWFHQVRSYGDRNIAINLWFIRLLWLRENDCNELNMPLVTNFQQFDFCPAEECLRAELVNRNKLAIPLSVEAFQKLYGQYVQQENSEDNRVQQVFELLDVDRDGLLSLEEMCKPEADTILKLFPKYKK